MRKNHLLENLLCLLWLPVLLPGCAKPRAATVTPSAPPQAQDTPVFVDVARTAGIDFRQGHGGKRPLTILETTGSGCAFLDYDNDGWLDLFLAGQPRCALYHNNRDGTFTEVTKQAGLEHQGFWIGCGTGDYDNDGDTDLFVTGNDICALYRNNGNGTFADVTRTAGIRNRGWQTSCVFGDVDRDGFLDLYICYYVHFGPKDLQYCTYGGTKWQIPCGPDAYKPQIGEFYHNNGNGTFTEATRRFGMDTAHGKAWGAAFADIDDDGLPDLYIANDEMSGDLFHNRGKGRMENIGDISGTATNRDGGVQGGMGADFGDFDNDGRLDLVVTTFWMEPKSLYRNEGNSQFAEVSYPTGIATATLKRVGFGTRLADFNNDGWCDLFILNGHVRDAAPVNPDEAMPQRMQLFLNEGGRRFQEVSDHSGEPFQRLLVGRGAAFGDFDKDGNLDIAVIDSEGTALLLRNTGPADKARPRHWLSVRVLTGDKPRDAISARITLEAGGKRQVREAQTSGSILSAHDPRVHFGLGAVTEIDRLTVRWPDGKVSSFSGLAADREVCIQQGRGIVQTGEAKGANIR